MGLAAPCSGTSSMGIFQQVDTVLLHKSDTHTYDTGTSLILADYDSRTTYWTRILACAGSDCVSCDSMLLEE